jgi:hydroxymethylbilane synthase
LVKRGLVESYELVVVETIGDARLDLAIADIARQGVFTSEVESAVIEGRADVAVHSAKDLPSSQLDPELVLAAAPLRADPRDVLVGATLAELLPGSKVATGSQRRRLQLSHAIPGLEFVELRGNIATRLAKVPLGGAVIMAYAALERLDLLAHVAEVLEIETMLPQVGQGVIALRARADNDYVLSLVHAIDDAVVHRALRAERAFLATLGGGCEAPVGAFATVDEGSQEITLEALYGFEDGSNILRIRRSAGNPEELGADVARELLRSAAIVAPPPL